jgi:general stress protein 26
MAKAGNRPAELLGKLLEDIDIAMLTTIGRDGLLVSRPLSTQRSSYDGRRVWFFTEADSPKVAEIRRNPKVNLAYASKEKNTYVSLAGIASVNRDRALIGEFWNDALKAFFPGGKDDPNLVLLEVEPRTVEYWDGPSSLIGKAISFLVARVTKKEELMGENRMLDTVVR